MNTTKKEPQLPSRVMGPSGKLYVSDGGAGDIPVLFVHSFGGNSNQWQNQLEHLRPNRRALALDLRGHGQSEEPMDGNYDVESLSNDISAVVDSLGLKQVVLVGHSMGGSAAIAYAGRHPERVAGLLITGTPGKTPPEQSRPIVQSLESEKYEKVMRDYMDKLLTHANPSTEKMERDGMSSFSKEKNVAIVSSVFKYDPLPDLRDYPGPKLIISRPDDDPPNSLHRFFPGIPYKIIAGTSHWIHQDRPVEFNRALDEFLVSVEDFRQRKAEPVTQ